MPASNREINTDHMAPSKVDANGTSLANGAEQNGDANKDSIHLENLFIRDADVFQTSLNSEDYLDSLAPIITEALKANALGDFITKLNGIVKGKENELNAKSLDSAHDISTCIDTIDVVSKQSTDLSKNLMHVNEFLNKSVIELIAKKKVLIKSKETVRNINETSMVMSLCVLVLEITNKILDWIKQHKYFNALKLIDELTTIHLPKVKDFSFSVRIYNSIPHLTSMIKEESFENLCKWLSVQIERKIDAIGDRIFQNLADLQRNWEQLQEDDKSSILLSHRLNSAVEFSMREPELNFNVFESRELNINMSPIYDCILVYQSLGELPSLSAAYHKEWMKKYQRVIYPITLSLSVNEKLAFYQEPTVAFPDLNSLELYLQKIAAFFIVDKQLNTKTKLELRSNTTSDDLWESFAIKLKPVLINFLERRQDEFQDLDNIKVFKDTIGDFLQVMENSQFKISELYDILTIVFKDYFAPILIQHFREEFIESIKTDKYRPLVVENSHDYENVMRICWYKNNASFAPKNVKSMPVSFPFSEDYVHYCLGIRTLLQEITEFISKHYSYDLNELNRIIVNGIFEKVLSNESEVGICNDIKAFITTNSNNKEVIAQSYTNLEYYLFSLYEIGTLIDRKLRQVNGIGIINIDTNSTFKLNAIELFSSVRRFSEDAIFQMVDQKVKELLDMVEYDNWFPDRANQDPNIFIIDFSLFLDNLFTSIFSSLPTSFRTLGLFRSYDFISEHFLTLLYDVRLFNRIAIENLNLDVMHLETSMAKLAATEVNQEEGALQSTFAELRQSIDLLLLPNYEEFVKNPTFRMRRFDRLKYESALKLIQKMQLETAQADNASIYTNENGSGLLNREASILGGSATKFANWGKFRKNES